MVPIFKQIQDFTLKQNGSDPLYPFWVSLGEPG